MVRMNGRSICSLRGGWLCFRWVASLSCFSSSMTGRDCSSSKSVRSLSEYAVAQVKMYPHDMLWLLLCCWWYYYSISICFLPFRWFKYWDCDCVFMRWFNYFLLERCEWFSLVRAWYCSCSFFLGARFSIIIFWHGEFINTRRVRQYIVHKLVRQEEWWPGWMVK